MKERLLTEAEDINTNEERLAEIFEQANREAGAQTGSIVNSWLYRRSLQEWRKIALQALKHPKFPPLLLIKTLEKDPQDYDIAASIGENPSAPLELLYKVWVKAPDSFLSNPIVQLLQLESPDFWQKIPAETMKALLGLPGIGATIFEFAIKRHEPEIRRLVAQHIMAPPNILEELARSNDDTLLEKLARNPSASLKTIERFLGHSAEIVRKAATENRSLPPYWAALLRKIRESISHSAKLYPALTDEEFCMLARSGPYLQGYVTRHPMTPAAVLAALAVHHGSDICQEVRGEIPIEWLAQIQRVSWSDVPTIRQIALHPNTTDRLLKSLASHFRFEVREAITKRATLDESIQQALLAPVGNQERLYLSICTNTRIELSKRQDLTESVVRQLFLESNAAIRENLAQRPGLTTEQMETLLYDKHPRVVLAFARSISDPIWLQKLTESQHPEVRRIAFQKLAIPEAEPLSLTIEYAMDEYLLFLSRGPYVRELLTQNPHTPDWVKERLATSEHSGDRLFMAQSQFATSQVLSMLARDESPMIRAEVAKNPKTPLETLQKLANSEEELSLQKLAENLAITPELLRILQKKPSPSVLIRLLQNPALHADTKQKILESAPPGILPQIAKDAASPEVLQALFQLSPNLKIKRALAVNPHLPDGVLDSLKKERDNVIQKALADRPTT
jgi:hypothetical protein